MLNNAYKGKRHVGPTSCHELASQFGKAFFNTRKTHKNYREDRHSRNCLLNEPATPVTMPSRLNRQRLVVGAATTAVILSGDRLRQNSEKQQVKTATMRVYTFTAWTMWFRNYYVAYAFVVCVKINNEELFLMLSRSKIHIILVLDMLRCGA